ncbi:EamA/RhaT family transporter [Soehngenia longivitae]|uniref:EamA/RhaT family transporter n=1 Tax=Soehngenia longivitae TaxID=2562294 RepID=A0A4Z0D7D7_9FIRM|nr:DMT family transporter [Soehngenia longivitae]TFZ40769.1 EamA/RhaT family transporter [Soehngenia longivitae]
MDKKKIISIVFLLITVLAWGISFLSIKISLTVFPPVSLAFYRFLIAGVIQFLLIKMLGINEKIDKKDLPLLIVAGLTGITIYYILENNGLMRISANDASIIVAMLPVFAAIIEKLILKKKMNFIVISGIILSIIGVFLVIGAKLEGGSLVGYLLMFLSAISFAIYIVVTKPLFQKYSDITIAFYQSIIGCIGFIPFLFFEEVKWELMDFNILINFLFLAIICSAIANYIYLYALNNTSVSVASIFLNLIPVVTFISSFIIYDEKLSGIQLFGALIVIASVTMVTSSESS